jgi:hypothetical protein
MLFGCMQTIQTTEIKVRKSVKASKFTEGQKAFILKQGEEGTPVGGICRKGGSARRPT